MAAPLDILSVTRAELAETLGRLNVKSIRANKGDVENTRPNRGVFENTRPNRGAFHADALFKDVYENARLAPEELSAFADNPALAASVRETFRLALPDITGRQGDGETYKFLLKLDGPVGATEAKPLESESVVIPMKHHKTLCVSSQVGCKMGCRFCETAQMGFLRNLTAGEIVAQVFTARHVLGEPIENIVFMGMGEPTDNLDAVMTAIRILSDQHGFGIPLRSITVSTVGSVPGILRLAEAAKTPGHGGGLRGLRLAVSLNASDDTVRDALMPINRTHDMAALREAFLQWPLPRPADFILAEYVLIAGINDGPEHADQLADYLRGTPTCVNLIPYNPRLESPYARPAPERVTAFFKRLLELGQYARIRGTKGDEAMAACGQLGNRTLSRRANRLATPV
jgi:23S rRNA (adenine2503-C2)-methyltransferase